MKALILKHIDYENPGCIQKFLKHKKVEFKIINVWQKGKFPDIKDFDILIIMGGPMSVHDINEFKGLIKEKEYIKGVIEKGKKVLGICLGAQLLAENFGAKIYKNKFKEIGWYPVKLTEDAKRHYFFNDIPNKFLTFHWHNDTFSLPKGSIRIAASEACENQGFALGKNIIGLQFHPEVTEETLKAFIRYGANEIKRDKFVQSKQEIIKNKKFIKINNEILYKILDKFIQ